MTRSIKIEERTYRKLARVSRQIQSIIGRSVSLDEAIWRLLKGTKEESTISDLAGTWEMSESEAKEIEKVLWEGWKCWKLPRSA